MFYGEIAALSEPYAPTAHRRAVRRMRSIAAPSKDARSARLSQAVCANGA